MSRKIRLIVVTAVSTGMRISEILGLKWKWIDLDKDEIHIEERQYRGNHRASTKSSSSRRIVPLADLNRIFRERKAALEHLSEYVFCREDGSPLDDRALLRPFLRPTAKRLGWYFPGFGWHSFRQMLITLIQEEGASPVEARDQAGHGAGNRTEHYTWFSLDRRRRLVRKVQRRLFGKDLALM